MFFFVDETAWDQQRKRHVLMAGGLKPAIEGLLNVLPQRPAIGPHDHAAANRRVIGKLRLQHQLVVPLRKILCAGRKLLFGHAAVCPFLSDAITELSKPKSVSDTRKRVNVSNRTF